MDAADAVSVADTEREAPPAPPPERRGSTLARHPALWIAAVDVLLIVGFGVFSQNHVFFNGSNFTNMALDSAQVVMLAVGSAMLLGAAELDISLGANVILSSVVGGRVMVSVAGVSPDLTSYQHLGRGIAAGIAAAVATGTAFGLVNGLIVTRLRVNSFIATLGTLGIGTGLSLVVSNGSNVEGIPYSIQDDFGINDVGGHTAAGGRGRGRRAGALAAARLHALRAAHGRDRLVAGGGRSGGDRDRPPHARALRDRRLRGGDLRRDRHQPLRDHEPVRPSDGRPLGDRRGGDRRHQPLRRADLRPGGHLRRLPGRRSCRPGS